MTASDNSYIDQILKTSGVADRLAAFAPITGIPLRLLTPEGKPLWQSNGLKFKVCEFIQNSAINNNVCREACQKALRESIRWGDPFIGVCCNFLMQLALPVMENGKVVGCLSASPFLMIDSSELETNEINRMIKGPGRRKDLRNILSSISVVHNDQITKATHVLFQLGDALSEPNLGCLLKIQEIQRLQGKIADHIVNLKDLDRDLDAYKLTRLSFEQEMELKSRISHGNKSGAEEILYSLLAINLSQYLDNLELLKVSILELFAVLSRIAVELGAKTQDVLGTRYACLTELASIDGHENICLWLVQAFEQFIDTIEVTRQTRMDERLRRAIELIENRYHTPLTIKEISQHVCLSPSRLSHIVKSQLGFSLRDYIKKLRIEKAKVLLIETDLSISEIATEVGYPDQSYFTKSFKSNENCTPNSFRKSGFLTKSNREPKDPFSQRRRD